MSIITTPEFWYIASSIAAAFMIYFLSQNKKTGKKFILKLYKANQTLSLEIQKNLSEFIEKHNAYNAIAFPDRNITYGHFLEQMQEQYKINLSDKLYEDLKKMKLTKPQIDSMTESINKQNESLRLVDIDIKLVIKKADSIIK